MRERILTVKEIKAKHGLSNPQIMDIVADNNGYVSERTMQNIFCEGSENKKFQYHSIADVYEALVAIYGEDYSSDDVVALNNMVRERNKQIDSLMIQLDDQQEAFKELLALYDERKRNFEKTIEILESQVKRLEKQLDVMTEAAAHKDAILERIYIKE